MKDNLKSGSRWMGVLLLFLLLFPFNAQAAPVAEITFIRGSVDISRGGEARYSPASQGEGLNAGDIVRTKSRSRAQITFTDGSKLNLAQSSKVKIKDFSYAPEEGKRKSLLQIFRGKLRAIVSRLFKETDSSFVVETPTAVAAVRGTDFFEVVNLFPPSSDTIVLEGDVGTKNILPEVEGETRLGAGEAATVEPGKAPVRRPVTLEEIKALLLETSAGGDDRKNLEKLSKKLGEDVIEDDPFSEPHGHILPPATPPITETERELLNVPVDVELEFP